MKYSVEIFCGKVFCGNGLFDTFEECVKFAYDDGICTKAIIHANGARIAMIKFDR